MRIGLIAQDKPHDLGKCPIVNDLPGIPAGALRRYAASLAGSQFIDPKSGNGMSAVIEKKTPGEFMSFRHVADIRNGQEQPPAAWSGAHENDTLRDNCGSTTLSVDLDAPDEFKKMFEDKFPQALQRVKTLAEPR
jgi:hypothetical protein